MIICQPPNRIALLMLAFTAMANGGTTPATNSNGSRRTAALPLRAPPSSWLEQLRGDREGQWGIRINDQRRICFRWEDRDAYDVQVTDYHGRRGARKHLAHPKEPGLSNREQLDQIIQQRLETYLSLAREDDWDGERVPAYVGVYDPATEAPPYERGGNG